MPKNQGSLGFSIIGGTDHSCVPFGAREPGIFISHVSMNNLIHKNKFIFLLLFIWEKNIIFLYFGKYKIHKYIICYIIIKNNTRVDQ